MRVWLVALLVIGLLGAQRSAADYPNEGCFWTGNCVNGWMGGCGDGRVVVGKSENCAGLCPPPQYQPCPLFTTHFQCCNQNKPKVSRACTKCPRRVDFGKAYLCCEDCSDPIIANKDTGEGFCMTGARLAISLKPVVTYKWRTGAWSNCSASCGGGLMKREVTCHGLDPLSGQPSGPAVDDDHCQDEPASREACNLHPCPKPAPKREKKHPKSGSKSSESKEHVKSTAGGSKEHSKRRAMSGWWVALIVLLCIGTLAGGAYGGYMYYQRGQSSDHGFVYVMLEGYN